jgi:hypothetical protein
MKVIWKVLIALQIWLLIGLTILVTVLHQNSSTTNITSQISADSVTIESSSGTDAVIASATTALAGWMSGSDKLKLNNIMRNFDSIEAFMSSKGQPYGIAALNEHNHVAEKHISRGTFQASWDPGLDMPPIPEPFNFSQYWVVEKQGLYNGIELPGILPDVYFQVGDWIMLDPTIDNWLHIINNRPTNLIATFDASSTTIISSTARDGQATIGPATELSAGIMTAQDKIALQDLDTFMNTKGAPSGLASLDGNGFITSAQLPFSGLSFQNSWNPALNELPVSALNELAVGDYWVIDVAGEYAGPPMDGIVSNTYIVGDYVLFGNSNLWVHLDNSSQVGTNLALESQGDSVTISSSTGSDATIPGATQIVAGVMTAQDKTELTETHAALTAFIETRAAPDGLASLDDTGHIPVDQMRDVDLTYGEDNNPTSVTILCSAGSDAIIPGATQIAAGVMTAQDKTQLTETHATLTDFIETKAVPNGLASLDATGHLPTSQLNLTGLDFQSTWNPTLNKIPVTVGGGTLETGQYWIIDVSGTYAGPTMSGIVNQTYVEGDWVLRVDTFWSHIGYTPLPTNLASVPTTTNVTLTSSTGNDGVILAASASRAGVMTSANSKKLATIATDAQKNVTVIPAFTTTETNVKLQITQSGQTTKTANIPLATDTKAGLLSPSNSIVLKYMVYPHINYGRAFRYQGSYAGPTSLLGKGECRKNTNQNSYDFAFRDLNDVGFYANNNMYFTNWEAHRCVLSIFKKNHANPPSIQFVGSYEVTEFWSPGDHDSTSNYMLRIRIGANVMENSGLPATGDVYYFKTSLFF